MSKVPVSQEKKDKVAALKTDIQESALVVISDYRGLTANEMTDLRSKIREEGGSAVVSKNTLSRVAFGDLEIEYPAEALQGPTLIVQSDDAAKVSKVIVNFTKENEKLVIKGGVLQNNFINEKAIKELAKLPSRDELIAKAVGQIKAPLSGLVRGLSSPITGLIQVLRAIENKKEEV